MQFRVLWLYYVCYVEESSIEQFNSSMFVKKALIFCQIYVFISIPYVYMLSETPQ